MLVVLHGRPAASPAPPDPVECAYEGPALVRHSGTSRRTRDVRPARAVGRATARDVRVLDRVHVDRRAVGVVRPARRPLDVATVERRRVVGLDRAEVAGAVGIDGDHPPDREPRRVEVAEDLDELPRDVAMDDEPARPRLPSNPQWDSRSSRRSRSATGQPGRHDTPVMRFACAESIRSIVPRNRCGAVVATLTSAAADTSTAPRTRPSSPVGAGRLELPASRSQSERSTRLSYAPRGHRVAG